MQTNDLLHEMSVVGRAGISLLNVTMPAGMQCTVCGRL